MGKKKETLNKLYYNYGNDFFSGKKEIEKQQKNEMVISKQHGKK